MKENQEMMKVRGGPGMMMGPEGEEGGMMMGPEGEEGGMMMGPEGEQVE